MRRCEYRERKTPSKNISEFLKPFSSRSHFKLFFGPPCIQKFLQKFLQKLQNKTFKAHDKTLNFTDIEFWVQNCPLFYEYGHQMIFMPGIGPAGNNKPLIPESLPLRPDF